MQQVSCEICGIDDSELLFAKREVPHAAGPIVQCRKCGLVYVNPREGKKQWFNVPKIHDTYVDLLDVRTPVYASRLEEIEKYRKGGRILDVGCYIGAFLNVAMQNGWSCYGVEPSSVVSAYAKEKYGIEVFPGFLQDARFPDNHFDVVVMFHVLEHLPSPRETLKEILRILKPDGLLAIEVPDIDHPVHRMIKKPCWLFVPGHLFYFSPRTLKKLLRSEGFEMIKSKASYKVIDLKRLLQLLSKLIGANRSNSLSKCVERRKPKGAALRVRTSLNFMTLSKPVK